MSFFLPSSSVFSKLLTNTQNNIARVGNNLTFPADGGFGNVHASRVGLCQKHLVTQQCSRDASRIRLYEYLSRVTALKAYISRASLEGELLLCDHILQGDAARAPDGRKVRGTIHWVSASDCAPCEIRLYDRLFCAENPMADGKENYLNHLNPNSLEILNGCLVEGGIGNSKPGDTFQFMRQGYFCVDKASTDEKLVFNRTVQLNSSYKK